ncbi:tetratricopeptide repeat protein [Rhodohalobacter sp.]|uniref:tetratricopeptide repeat protein n=1 Tax=Rhodohalobacter sp. TaxID=1974210 RepID=UPI00356AE946
MSEKEIYREITRYIDGDLSKEEVEDLWAQFVDNPEYYKWFETELHLRDLAKRASESNIHSIHSDSEQKTPISFWKSSKGWILAAAAAVLISFGLQFHSNSDTLTYHPDSISQIDLNEMSGSDILRSEGDVSHTIDIEINRALASAYEDDSEGAVRKFRALLLQDPDPQQKARIELNLGILYYNMAVYEQATVFFETVTKTDAMNRFFTEKAWWFLGNAYLNLEMLKEAREAVHNAYTSDGRYVDPALSLLKKLDEELGNETNQADAAEMPGD